ncbi:MAG: DNA repair protein RadC [Rickettsiales bacterium]|nr:DNA repair protein RadC [Rickettsiales bacterium]
MVAKLEAKQEDYRTGHRGRLRQRFIAGGVDAIADYELLELLLFAAHPRGDVKPIAHRLLKHFGGAGQVLSATPEALAAVEGIGEAAIAALKAAEASAQVLLRSRVDKGPVISNWTSLLDYGRSLLAGKKKEEFHILFLNSKNELLADEKQQSGTVNHAPVYPREVISRALEIGASAIILMHNHPSGDPTPSPADIKVTRDIVQAGLGVSISVHDHLIIGADGYYSFKSEGLI